MTNYESYRASLIASNKALIASLGIQKVERVPVKRVVNPDLYSHLGKRKSLKRAAKAEAKVYSSRRRPRQTRSSSTESDKSSRSQSRSREVEDPRIITIDPSEYHLHPALEVLGPAGRPTPP